MNDLNIQFYFVGLDSHLTNFKKEKSHHLLIYYTHTQDQKFWSLLNLWGLDPLFHP